MEKYSIESLKQNTVQNKFVCTVFFYVQKY